MADFGGSSLMARRQPASNDFPLDEQEAALNAVANWLGLDWLNSDSDATNPAVQLWRRQDWLATAELVTVGAAIEHARRSAVTQRTLAEVASKIRGGETNGHLFELLSAAMFDSGGHPVTIPEPGTKGYDFLLHLPHGRDLRVSCKVLERSWQERSVHEFGAEVYAALRPKLAPQTPTAITLNLNVATYTAADFDKAIPQKIVETYLDWQRHSRRTDWAREMWSIQFVPLAPYPGRPFWPGAASHTLVLTTPHLADEQRRFTDVYSTAASGLRRHCSDVSPRLANAILIRVPESVSITKAAKLMAESWTEGDSVVSVVFLYRTSLDVHHERGTRLQHELAFVHNPDASVKLEQFLPPDGFHLQVPTGQTNTEEARTYLTVGNRWVSLTDRYSFVRGQHYPVGSLAGDEYQFPPFPSIEVSLVLGGPGEEIGIAPKVPPSANLVFL